MRTYDNQLMALVVAPSWDDMDRVSEAVHSGTFEPVVRVELKMPAGGVAMETPARILDAVLTRVRFELVMAE